MGSMKIEGTLRKKNRFKWSGDSHREHCIGPGIIVGPVMTSVQSLYWPNHYTGPIITVKYTFTHK